MSQSPHWRPQRGLSSAACYWLDWWFPVVRGRSRTKVEYERMRLWSHLNSAGTRLQLSGADLSDHNNMPALFFTLDVRDTCSVWCSSGSLLVFLCVSWHTVTDSFNSLLPEHLNVTQSHFTFRSVILIWSWSAWCQPQISALNLFRCPTSDLFLQQFLF